MTRRRTSGRIVIPALAAGYFEGDVALVAAAYTTPVKARWSATAACPLPGNASLCAAHPQKAVGTAIHPFDRTVRSLRRHSNAFGWCSGQ